MEPSIRARLHRDGTFGFGARRLGAAEGAIRLVGLMRQFEMLQKAVSLGAEMNKKAIEEVAKV